MGEFSTMSDSSFVGVPLTTFHFLIHSCMHTCRLPHTFMHAHVQAHLHACTHTHTSSGPRKGTKNQGWEDAKVSLRNSHLLLLSADANVPAALPL